MTTEEWDAGRQLRRDRRAATTSAMTQHEQRQTQGNLPEQQAMNHSSQAMPSMNHSQPFITRNAMHMRNQYSKCCPS